MPVDDAAVRDFGLDLEHLPNLTELRLPSRISCLAAFGLGFIGLLCVVFTMIAGLMAMDRRQSLIGPVIVSLIVVALLFGLYQAAASRALRREGDDHTRPSHRAATLGEWGKVSRALSESGPIRGRSPRDRHREKPQANQNRHRIEAEAQQAIVGFLNRVIAGHLHPDLEELPAVSRSVEQSPVGDALRDLADCRQCWTFEFRTDRVGYD